jgi:disulfide bond formation protein DsbB
MNFINSIINKLAADNFRLFFALIILISVGILASAFSAENMGFSPCPLCIYQRYPYVFLIIVGALALIDKSHHLLWLIAIILIEFANLALSGYHSSIELGFLPPLESCHSNLYNSNMSLQEIESHINITPASDCSKPSVVILGISMAQWNYVFNLILVTISTMVYFKKPENAKTVL